MQNLQRIQKATDQRPPVYIQPQLEIGEENDEYEQQANQVADKVMRMTDPEAGNKKIPYEKVQMMSTGMPPVQKMSAGPPVTMMATPKVEQGIYSSKGSGQNLQPEIQDEMSSKIGADFSNVNIHTDANAVQMNKEIGAKAFTHGNDIYFNQGQYNPSSGQGKHLLAHELTHTVQQSGMINQKIQKEPKDDPFLSQTVYMPSAYNTKTDSIVLYLKKPGTNPKSTKDLDYVTTIHGLGEWSFKVPAGASMAEVFIFMKDGTGVMTQLEGQQLLTNTTLVFKLYPKEVVKGDNWEGSAYQKVFNSLTANSSTYGEVISDFKGGDAKYNLKMNYSKAAGQTGPGRTTTSDLYGANPNVDPSLVEGGTVSSYFNPDKDSKVNTESKTINLNDLGRALTIVHEGVHAQMMIDFGYEANFGSTHHDAMSEDMYRNKIVSSLKEFTTANKFVITDQSLELISWYGLLNNKTNLMNFQNWVTNNNISDSVAKEITSIDLMDNAKVQAWINKFNEKIETIIYNPSSDPNRYMIK